MRYDLRHADLGPGIHAALGVSRSYRVLVVNQRPVPGTPEQCRAIRQAVQVAVGCDWGKLLMHDKELDEALARLIDHTWAECRAVDAACDLAALEQVIILTEHAAARAR